MASHPQPSPPTALHPHHVSAVVHPAAAASTAVAAPQVNGQVQAEGPSQPKTAAQHMAAINEAVWLQIGECFNDLVVVVLVA